MGRPSLAPERREQLLDAAEQVVLSMGVAGTTVAAVARAAGTHASLVHHYLGSRDEMLGAAVDRVLRRVEDLVARPGGADPRGRDLATLLDLVFGPALTDPGIEQLVEHLVVASYTDGGLRRRLATVYANFEAILDAALAEAHPDAGDDARARTANALLALAHAAPTFAWLGLPMTAAGALREAADQLVRGLAARTRDGAAAPDA